MARNLLLTEPIIAYRAWRRDCMTMVTSSLFRIPDVNYLLPIVAEGQIYHPHKIMEASCYCAPDRFDAFERLHLDTNPICVDGTCGIYAFKKLNDVFAFLYDAPKVPNLVIGKVALWGQVEEHRQGYRAQLAYPKSFFEVLDPKILDRYYLNYLSKEDIKSLANAWAVDIE